MDESWRIKADDKRRRPRQSLIMQAELRIGESGAAAEVRVRNLSSGGALVACRTCPPLGERVRITLRGIGEVAGHVSRASASTIAIKFDAAVDPVLAQPAPHRDPVQILHHVGDPRRPGLSIK